jgi:peptidoglycan/LPS O-acetylase OafA/YrhL
MTGSKEIPSLTGLRGVAALCVVLTHFAVWMRVTPADATPDAIASVLGLSSIGMATFFTLSGFVIALSYSHWGWGERPGFCLVRLFFYRFARLYPAFLLFALLIVLRSARLHDALSELSTQEYILEHLLLWQSWFLVKFDGLLSPYSAFHVSWSLSTECGLYAMFGLGAIAATLVAFKRKALLLGVGFFCAIGLLLGALWVFRSSLMPEGWSAADWYHWVFHVSPLGVSVQFGIGVAAWWVWQSGMLSERAQAIASNAGGIALLALCIAVKNIPVAPYAIEVAVALVTASIMVGSSAPGMTNALLGSSALVYIGTISYSLYLFHFWVPSPYAGTIEQFDLRAAAVYLVNAATGLSMAVFLATGVYRLVEVPGRRLVRRWADRLLGLALMPADHSVRLSR